MQSVLQKQLRYTMIRYISPISTCEERPWVDTSSYSAARSASREGDVMAMGSTHCAPFSNSGWKSAVGPVVTASLGPAISGGAFMARGAFRSSIMLIHGRQVQDDAT